MLVLGTDSLSHLVVFFQPLDVRHAQVPLAKGEVVGELAWVCQPGQLLQLLFGGCGVVLKVNLGQGVCQLLHPHDLAVVLCPLLLTDSLADVPEPTACLWVLLVLLLVWLVFSIRHVTIHGQRTNHKIKVCKFVVN